MMDDSFDNSWQRRWAGLADRLEVILENNFYRFVLCTITAMVVITYIGVAARLAEPPRFVESNLVSIDESALQPSDLGVYELDAINRSINRLAKLRDVLALKPQHLTIRPTLEQVKTPYAIETHVLRLWLDEARGFAFQGHYDLTADSIARAIIFLVFPSSETVAAEKLPDADTSWYAQVKADGATPMSLSWWLTSQMVSEARDLSTSSRVAYVRNLVRRSTDLELLRFEISNQWPKVARAYAPAVRTLVSRLAPRRADHMNFKIALYVVTSCQMPRLADLVTDLKDVEAQDVVWARICDDSISKDLVEANSAPDFAAKNPDVAFAQISLEGIRLSLQKGWLDKKTDIGQFVVESRDTKSRRVASQLRTVKEDWDAKSQAFRVYAPVEILKLVRLRPI